MGTFKRIRTNEVKRCKVGQTYLIGSDTRFLINIVFVPHNFGKENFLFKNQDTKKDNSDDDIFGNF